MRYYYYGNGVKTEKKRLKASVLSEKRPWQVILQESLLQDQDLVIEDDTIYEIDRECLRCRQNRK